MVTVNKFFTPVFLVVVYVSLNDAAPWSTSSKAPTHRVRHVGRGVPIETFHPTSTYETFGAGIDSPGFRGPDSLSAFNFQVNNFGKGGQGNDPILMSVQDPSGTNNANFATPPDDQPGICRMFIFNLTIPDRDGSLENDIPTHEMTHGITNRMTGGGTGRCLQTLEAGSMGEGWSDAMADWNEQTSGNIKDYVLGQYVINDPAGIRSHPYSTSSTTNPLRYSSLQTLNEVHNIGEVWANLLHNVHAALVAVHGFSTSARTNPTGTEGNIVFMHLFIDGLSLQPCNPTFPSGRDALIQADVNRYGGANRCLLWKIFASRGLGVQAADHNDDSTVPADC